MDKLTLYCKESQNYLTSPESFEESFFGKKKKKKDDEKGKLGSLIDKIKGGIKKAVDKVGQIGLLSPFKKAMKKALDIKGVKYRDDISDIATKFYNYIVKGGNSSSFEVAQNFDPVTLSVIISSIVSFFRALKAKKDSGEPMPEWQQDTLQLAEAGVDLVKGEVVYGAQQKAGEFIFKAAPFILIFVFFMAFSGRR